MLYDRSKSAVMLSFVEMNFGTGALWSDFRTGQTAAGASNPAGQSKPCGYNIGFGHELHQFRGFRSKKYGTSITPAALRLAESVFSGSPHCFFMRALHHRHSLDNLQFLPCPGDHNGHFWPPPNATGNTHTKRTAAASRTFPTAKHDAPVNRLTPEAAPSKCTDSGGCSLRRHTFGVRINVNPVTHGTVASGFPL